MNRSFGLALGAVAVIATWGMANVVGEKAPKAGTRAVTLPVHGHQLAYLSSGDRVDIVMTFQIQNAKGEAEPVSATILQNIPILDLDKSAGLVQLQLDPGEAQYAVLSMQDDRDLWITKREPGDTATPAMEMAAFRKLFK